MRPLIVLGLVLLVLTPIANGTILNLQGYTWQRYYPTTIPQRYSDLNSWLVGQPGNYKVMWVPSGGPYDWKPYDVTGFPDLFSSKPSVSFANIYPNPLNSTDHIGRMLSFLGVEYIMYHNDSIAYSGVPLLQELLAQKDLSIVQSYNDTFNPLDSSQRPFPTSSGVQVSNVPFQTSTSSLVRGQVSNLTLQYTVPQSVVNQGFHGQFWDGFGILIQGFPSGSVDVASRIFFATVASQTLTSDTTGSALFSGIEVQGNYPESTIDLYANFYDGSYRPLTPLFLVARLSLTPARLTNQFLVFKNNDFGGSVFTQNPGAGQGNQNVTNLLAGNTTGLSSSSASVTNVNQVGNVEYDVTVYATGPFVLVLAEPYDRLWSAYLSSGQLGSVPIYQLSNGFVIGQTGTLTIRLYYGLQGYLTVGGWLSIGGLAGASVVAILLSRRRRTRLVQSAKTVPLVQVPITTDVLDPTEGSGG